MSVQQIFVLHWLSGCSSWLSRKNFFLVVHNFNAFVPTAQQAGQAAVLVCLSLSMYLWFFHLSHWCLPSGEGIVRYVFLTKDCALRLRVRPQSVDQVEGLLVQPFLHREKTILPRLNEVYCCINIHIFTYLRSNHLRQNSQCLTGGYNRIWHRVVDSGQSAYVAWRAGIATLSQSRLDPPVSD
jgi:hypothetical protein